MVASAVPHAYSRIRIQRPKKEPARPEVGSVEPMMYLQNPSLADDKPEPPSIFEKPIKNLQMSMNNDAVFMQITNDKDIGSGVIENLEEMYKNYDEVLVDDEDDDVQSEENHDRYVDESPKDVEEMTVKNESEAEKDTSDGQYSEIPELRSGEENLETELAEGKDTDEDGESMERAHSFGHSKYYGGGYGYGGYPVGYGGFGYGDVGYGYDYNKYLTPFVYGYQPCGHFGCKFKKLFGKY